MSLPLESRQPCSAITVVMTRIHAITCERFRLGVTVTSCPIYYFQDVYENESSYFFTDCSDQVLININKRRDSEMKRVEDRA
jgi:hypothetical protein